MAITILPFISLFTTALHPSGSIPLGIEWPAEPQWGNFVKAFNQASMGTLLVSSTTIVLGVVPIALAHLDDGGLRHRAPADPRATGCSCCCSSSA